MTVDISLEKIMPILIYKLIVIFRMDSQRMEKKLSFRILLPVVGEKNIVTFK
jgi:hypothetical protein